MKQRIHNHNDKTTLFSSRDDVPIITNNRGRAGTGHKATRTSLFQYAARIMLLVVISLAIISGTQQKRGESIISLDDVLNSNMKNHDKVTTSRDVLDILSNRAMNDHKNSCQMEQKMKNRISLEQRHKRAKLEESHRSLSRRKKQRKVKMSASVSCPCGSRTHTDFKLNMAKMYGTGSYSLETLERCLSLSLPFKHDDPIECWPKMVIMPSFPTSGSGLARLLLQKASGLLVRMDHYNESSKSHNPYHMYNVSSPEKEVYSVSSPCNDGNADGVNSKSIQLEDTSLPIPMMGKPAIFKSHHTELHELALDRNRGDSHGGNIAGVVRLARNPGDQILRNYHRWDNKGCSNDKDNKEKCFREKAKSQCSRVVSLAQTDWLPFHWFWNDFGGGNVPQVIYHYENFSDGSKVQEATEKVLKFLRSNVSKEGSNTSVENDIGERIGGVVGAVEYEHGTLMAEICGKDEARQLHAVTKDVTEKLGYVFDEEAATWSLPLP